MPWLNSNLVYIFTNEAIILFESNPIAAIVEFFGDRAADVAVMPRLIDKTGDIFATFGVAQDEAIFPSVMMEPLSGGSVGEGVVNPV